MRSEGTARCIIINPRIIIILCLWVAKIPGVGITRRNRVDREGDRLQSAGRSLGDCNRDWALCMYVLNGKAKDGHKKQDSH